MTETPPDPTTYAATADVVLTLGPFGKRVEASPDIDLDAALDIAHGTVLDRLAAVYGTTLPSFAGTALAQLRWAEAQLAAAHVLDILRAHLDTVSDVPERLRRSAFATLDGGLVGYRPGDPSPAPEPGPTVPVDVSSPMLGIGDPGSNFPSPYVDPYRIGDPRYGATGPTTWVL